MTVPPPRGTVLPKRRRGNSTGFGRRPNPVFSEEYGAIRHTLVQARLSVGISQRELAKRLGKSPSHVARVEAGQRRVDTLELWQIARCLKLKAGELFARIVGDLEVMSAPAYPDKDSKGQPWAS